MTRWTWATAPSVSQCAPASFVEVSASRAAWNAFAAAVRDQGASPDAALQPNAGLEWHARRETSADHPGVEHRVLVYPPNDEQQDGPGFRAAMFVSEQHRLVYAYAWAPALASGGSPAPADWRAWDARHVSLKLCCLDYAPLRPLLEALPQAMTVEELLAELDDQDLVDCAPPPLRLLARLFVRRVLKPLRGRANPSLPTTAPPRAPSPVSVGLRGILLSSCHLGSDAVRLMPDKVCIVDVPARLPAILDGLEYRQIRPCEGLSAPPFARLDLSGSELFSFDVKHVPAIVETLVGLGRVAPGGLDVDLRENRIGDPPEALPDAQAALAALLSGMHGAVAFVNVCHNPLVGDKGKTFLRTLEPRLFDRLVWIPEAWLAARRWPKLLLDHEDDLVERIAAVHQQYYSDPRR